MYTSNPFHTFRHFDIGGFDARQFLGREMIELDQQQLPAYFRSTRVLITGAAGSIGRELALRICSLAPAALILVDQAETALYELELHIRGQFPDQPLNIFVADVANEQRITYIFQRCRPDMVFHAAAYKHVPVMEEHPYEALRTNVLGTKILADAAVQCNARKFILISTDKAINPAGIMGASKRLAELFLKLTSFDAPETEFITTRFGNVFGSAGSCIPVFKRQIESGGPITITHPEARRFLITLDEACQLVLEASYAGCDGDIVFLDMGEPLLIMNIVKQMLVYYGLSEYEVPIVFTGLRPGEKLLEELWLPQETEQLSRHPKVRVLRSQPVSAREFDALMGRFYDHSEPGMQELIMELHQKLFGQKPIDLHPVSAAAKPFFE